MKVAAIVKPGSKKGSLVEPGPDDDLVIYVRELAVDGKANKAVIELLAKHYGVSKSQITIASGHTSKHKIIQIDQ